MFRFYQISQSSARVNDGDTVRIGERNLQAGRVAPELLKTGIADRDGSPGAIKLELHRIVFMKVRGQRALDQSLTFAGKENETMQTKAQSKTTVFFA